TENLPGTEVSPKSPISLIFYTGGVGYYTHVEQVERDGNTFTIHYRIVPHQTRDITQHLAVIPVGMLQSGKYAVKVEQLPLREEDIDRCYGKALPRQVDRVCKSFDFIVIEER